MLRIIAHQWMNEWRDTMNIIHMKYFITAARYLNFSQAADKLYITQPALSRQISAIESELNLQLFMRDNRSVKLTPAGEALLEEFQQLYDHYNLAIARAQNIHKGLSGQLNIGILDGAIVGDLFPETLRYFNGSYPELAINLRNYSFHGLIDRLYDGRLDLIITLYFDIKNRYNIQYKIIEKTNDYVVVINNHRLAAKEKVSLSDFKDDTFIMASSDDSEESSKLIIAECSRQGFFPNIHFAPSIQTVMLLVESGVGVAILDGRNALRSNQSVKFLEVDSHFEPYLTVAWHMENKNPVLKTFNEVFWNNLKLN